MRLHVYYMQAGFGTQWVDVSVRFLPSCRCLHSLLNIHFSVPCGFSVAKSWCWLLSSFARVEEMPLQSPYRITLCCFLAFQMVILVSLG